MADPLQRRDIALMRADNPGPFTLRGTNTWLVGRDPCWVVDPGPALDAHVAAVLAEAERRGGIGGIALTHDHGDHADAAPAVRERAGGAGRTARACARRAGRPSARRAGPRRTSCSPTATRSGRCACSPRPATRPTTSRSSSRTCASPATRSSPRAASSSPPTPARCAATSRRSSGCARSISRCCAPGTARRSPIPRALLDRYLAHRADRERRLVAALADGLRAVDDLLDRVWDDAPPSLRLAATATLAAHLDKLDEDGALPAGVERPPWPPPGGLRPVV